jgi:ubiquinol-cytochrome c reductase iron-sulfur subunit
VTTTEEPHAEPVEDLEPVEDTEYGAVEDPAHFGIARDEPWPDDVPHGQDDTWWRYRDDPRGARRAEIRIAFFWTLTLLGGVGLAIVYCVGGQAQAEGSLLFVALAGLAVGFVLWARDLLPGHDVTASRGAHHESPPEDRRAVVEALDRGLEPIARRPFLVKMLGGVLGVFGLCAAFPLASLGPRPHTSLYHTAWGKGTRVVTEDGSPVRPGDLDVNGILTVFPEGGMDQAESSVVLINVGNADFEVKPGRQSWHIGGVVAFSKICTHAGCPVGLYNVESHQLVCPCHQSTFDVLSACNPVFGPASRSLPQLPLAVNQDGYLISQSDFTEAVGPGFWNRG